MTNLITATEAFDALLEGKTILCRPEGDMLDFADLDQFPASIFGKQGYEFCIKAELMELAGIQFTKPLVVHEVEDDQEIFIITPTRILRTKFNTENCEIFYSVMNGFAQADAENAVLQLKALGAIFGQAIDHVEIEDGFNDKPKNQRGKKAPQVKAEKPVIDEKAKGISKALDSAIIITEQPYVSSSEDFLAPLTAEPDTKPNANAQFEILLDAIRICNSEKELDSTCANLEKEGFSQEQIDQINLAKQERLTDLDAQEIDAANPIEMPANYKSLKQSISDATTPEAVNAVMNYTGKWTEAQRNVLVLEMHKKLTELDQGKPQEKEPPTLLAQIQVAPDFVTLDALVLEVSKRETLIQPKYMDAVKKRRFELENPAPSQPEANPDYLLGETF